MSDIGKLTRVPLREVWKHEAYDFTQWMEENIDVLNNVLAFDLVNVDREQAAGTGKIDVTGSGPHNNNLTNCSH
jgi:hypothetical protein